MGYIEEDQALRAPTYEKKLRFTFDKSMGSGGFQYVYKNGEVRCSQPLTQYAKMCRVAPEEMNAIHKGSLSFVYLDAGRWGDGCMNFGIVSGKDVYLCDYRQRDARSCVGGYSVPSSKNDSVRQLLEQLHALNIGVSIQKYAEAPDVSSRTEKDDHIYILIPDCHLPPISWYYKKTAVSVMPASDYCDPPAWFRTTKSYQRNQHLYRGWYGLKKNSDDYNRKNGIIRKPDDADIFGSAGEHLVRFLRGIMKLSNDLLSKVHVINLGDMFELWLNREYQFEADYGTDPVFKKNGENNAADWAAEVMLWNMEVIEAWRALESSGVGEVSYPWGNHEAYVMSSAVTSQISLKPRQPQYTGLNGDLHAEHGHRFDTYNFDSVSGDIKDFKGPFWANAAYWFPFVRDFENKARDPKTQRENYFLGASLVYLSKKFDQKKKPFSIFAMGHTHEKALYMFNIGGQYSIWE